MTTADGTSNGKLAWLRAGQNLLRAKGVVSVKIHALQAETGLTTGSFYHHFKDMATYLEELAGFWGSDAPDHFVEADDPDPLRRLKRLAEIAPREGLVSLDMAMRDWAGSNEVAAAAVARVDALLLVYVADAFRDLGFDGNESRLRAHAWMAFGVARMRPPWPLPADTSDRLIELLTRPA